MEPEPGPCNFDGHATDPFVACLVDPQLSLRVAAVRGCGGESDERSDLFAVFEFSRGEELGGEGPCTVCADGIETLELVSDLGVFGFTLGEQMATFHLDGEDLGTDETEAVMLEEDPDADAAWKWGSVPEALLFEPWLEVLRNRVDVYTVIGEQALDPVDVTGRILFERFEPAVELARVLAFNRRNLNDGPWFLTEVPTDEHAHKLDGVKTIGLAST